MGKRNNTVLMSNEYFFKKNSLKILLLKNITHTYLFWKEKQH